MSRELKECELVLDGLTGRRFVRLNGKEYEFAAGGTARIGDYAVTRFNCSCGDWRYRHPVEGCKHMQAAKALGLLPVHGRVLERGRAYCDAIGRA